VEVVDKMTFANKTLALFLAAAILEVSEASGQAFDGTKELRVVVENIDDEATICGLSEQSLLATTRNKVRQLGFQVAEASRVYLYVNVNTLYLDSIQLCFSSISTEISYYTMWLDMKGDRATSSVAIANFGRILSSKRPANGSRVLQSIDEMVGIVIDEWIELKPQRP
jgi:hypothetical protein